MREPTTQPWMVVEADIIVAFKRFLDAHMNIMGIEVYGYMQAEGINLIWHRIRHRNHAKCFYVIYFCKVFCVILLN